MTKRAIVLFNLGGPDAPESVQPFLFNLFNDPAIIGLPNPFRFLLAKLISTRRAPVAQEIYSHLGGKSPLLDLTRKQADALEKALEEEGTETRAFIAMRYWHPMSDETAKAVKAFDPDQIVLLPLYPQFSTTTTGSSVKEWHRAAKAAGLNKPTVTTCCYPEDNGFVDAVTRLTRASLAEAGENPRLLFSAHGLPKKVIAKGDPYQWQVEQSAARVVEKLAIEGLDWQVCYQSRVGPLEWIGPSTEDEIERAGRDGKKIVLVPIAFVSEHSETLVELDIEYRELADKVGVKDYLRVPTVCSEPEYIQGLAAIVKTATQWDDAPRCATGNRVCPATWSQCPCRMN
ncbi:MAG: ferrochelatase [Magnetovibrionaceae bacterium]